MSRSVLVTGASRGIGQQIALQLGAKGFDIIAHYNSDQTAAEAVVEAVQQSGAKARALQFDIADRETCAAVIEDDMTRNATYYGVVCNAGIHNDNAFPAMSGKQWDSVLRTNLDGFYNVLHPVVMPMVQAREGGRIVVMSSVSGIMGNRGQVNYSASKGGLIAATKALAVELAKRRITVNCVAPGLIETAMTEEIDAKLVREIIPARRMGRPKEVASLVTYLFSPDAEYITRQVISVNGGMI